MFVTVEIEFGAMWPRSAQTSYTEGDRLIRRFEAKCCPLGTSVFVLSVVDVSILNPSCFKRVSRTGLTFIRDGESKNPTGQMLNTKEKAK